MLYAHVNVADLAVVVAGVSTGETSGKLPGNGSGISSTAFLRALVSVKQSHSDYGYRCMASVLMYVYVIRAVRDAKVSLSICPS